MKQLVVGLWCILFAYLLNVALCDTFYLDFKESRRGVSLEHRFRILEASNFIPTTYDRTVNEHCSPGSTYINLDLPKTLVCVKDDKAHLITETSHLISRGKISLTIPRIYVKSTSSRVQEKKPEILTVDDKAWFYQNKTCMVQGRRDSYRCIDKLGNPIVDATIQRKPCYFVHGVGEKGNNTIKPNFYEYWGDVNSFMPQCNSFNFLYMDTKNNSWTSEVLVKKVCSLITTGTMKIENSYVFTHSMGGLIMTNGLMKGWCQINKANSRLYMSQPPLKGSLTARVVNDICKNEYGSLYYNVAVSMDYCLPDYKGAYPAYFPMDPSNPALKSVQYAAGVFNDGMLCGNCTSTSICGIGAPWETAGLKAIAVLSGLESPNDGMVALDSCKVTNPKTPWAGSSEGRYYMAPMNHADGTCRNGDSSVQQIYPCDWFGSQYMT
jgi:hypothetical protein